MIEGVRRRSRPVEWRWASDPMLGYWK